MIGLVCVLLTVPLGEPQAADPLKELLPGVRVGEGVVEFGGTVCADLSHPQTPVVYLELLVTGPDSREHESIVVTRVKPSAIHAGMLAAGFEPGHPVRRNEAGGDEAADGDGVSVQVRVEGDNSFVDLAGMAVHAEHGGRLTEAEGWGLVFAGSVVRDGDYAADRTGTIIGLTGFGTEVIGAAWTLSHRAAVDEPVWIVDKERVPAFGTNVTIRVIRAEQTDRVETPNDGAASVTDDRDAGSP